MVFHDSINYQLLCALFRKHNNAHKKLLFVALLLGIGTDVEESFTGNGTSIEKAQQAAAEHALKSCTQFKRPPKRQAKKVETLDDLGLDRKLTLANISETSSDFILI
jgi:hypothetical protein